MAINKSPVCLPVIQKFSCQDCTHTFLEDDFLIASQWSIKILGYDYDIC